MTRLVLVAAAALFNPEGQVLMAERPQGKAMAGLWEFPGGKIDPGETPEYALARELQEELGLQVNENSMMPLTFASHTYPDFHLLMPLYGCSDWSGTPIAREGQRLRWLDVQDLSELEAPAADIPLFDFLISGRQREP